MKGLITGHSPKDTQKRPARPSDSCPGIGGRSAGTRSLRNPHRQSIIKTYLGVVRGEVSQTRMAEDRRQRVGYGTVWVRRTSQLLVSKRPRNNHKKLHKELLTSIYRYLLESILQAFTQAIQSLPFIYKSISFFFHFFKLILQQEDLNRFL